MALAPHQLPPAIGLEFVNWIFWATLSGGTLLMLGLTEWRGGTSQGYRKFMAVTVAVCAGIWLLSELMVGIPEVVEPWGVVRRGLVWVFAAAAAGYVVTVFVDGRLSAAVAVAGGAVSLLALLTIPIDLGTEHPVPFGAGLVSAAVALGAVTAGMLLGHWYLVTPKLSPDPLRRLIRILIGALVAQGVLVGWSVLVAQDAVDSVPWLTGLRFVVGVVFPLVIAVLALRATDAPSMQSTTGLLYIGLAAVMTGTIGGAALVYFGLGAV